MQRPDFFAIGVRADGYPKSAAADIASLVWHIEHLESAIAKFCDHHSWAAECWKEQDHIAALFKIAAQLKGLDALEAHTKGQPHE